MIELEKKRALLNKYVEQGDLDTNSDKIMSLSREIDKLVAEIYKKNTKGASKNSYFFRNV